MRFLHFFISHSIFISCCAVGLCMETSLIMDSYISHYAYVSIFFSTLCSYNFYWLLSKFYFNRDFKSLLKNNSSNIILLVLGAVGVVYFFMKSELNFYFLVVSIFLTIIYSLPLWPFSFSKKIQKLGFLKTLLLAFTWAFVTVFLAFSMYAPGKITLTVFFVRFLFMLLLCIIFDKRDIVVDKSKGLQTLVSKIKESRIDDLFYFLLLLYFIVASYQFTFRMLHFYFMLPAVLSLILGFAYKKSNKPQGYLFYYFFIDGLMLVSFLLNFSVFFFVYKQHIL